MADCFIQLDQVSGESADHDFKDYIQVESWHWGIEARHTSAWANSPASGKADLTTLTFTHVVDSASPAIFARCATNRPIPNAKLVMRRAGGVAQVYLRIELKTVRIVKASLVHDAQNVLPLESVVLGFQQASYTYVPQSSTGGNRTGEIAFDWRAGDST